MTGGNGTWDVICHNHGITLLEGIFPLETAGEVALSGTLLGMKVDWTLLGTKMYCQINVCCRLHTTIYF